MEEKEPRSAVFISTSLHTHLALDLGCFDTIAHLKTCLRLSHSSCFPAYGEICVNTIKIKYRGHFYSLSDSIQVRMILVVARKSPKLYAEVSVPEEHLGEFNCAKVSNDNNNRSAAISGEKLNRPLNTGGVSLRATSSLGMKGIDNEQTGVEELPPNALVSPQPAVVAGTDLISGARQNNPEEGDKSRELSSGEAIRGTARAVVSEQIPAVIVGDDKSSGKKRKKPALKRESSRKQDPKEKKHFVCSGVVSPLTEPKEDANKKGMIHDKAEFGLTTSQGEKTGQVVPDEGVKGAEKEDIPAEGLLVLYAPEDEASSNSVEIRRKSTKKKVPSKEKTTYAREIYGWRTMRADWRKFLSTVPWKQKF